MDIQALARRAKNALEQQPTLRERIRRELSAENFERAGTLIHDYRQLCEDNAFVAEERQMGERILARDLRRARTMIENRQFVQANVLCRAITDKHPESTECDRLLRTIGRHRRWARIRRISITLLVVYVTYILSAAPVYRLLGRPRETAFDGIYAPVKALQQASLLGKPLRLYARLWGAGMMFRLEPAKD